MTNDDYKTVFTALCSLIDLLAKLPICPEHREHALMKRLVEAVVIYHCDEVTTCEHSGITFNKKGEVTAVNP